MMKAILEMEDAHQLITFQNATMMVETVEVYVMMYRMHAIKYCS